MVTFTLFQELPAVSSFIYNVVGAVVLNIVFTVIFVSPLFVPEPFIVLPVNTSLPPADVPQSRTAVLAVALRNIICSNINPDGTITVVSPVTPVYTVGYGVAEAYDVPLVNTRLCLMKSVMIIFDNIVPARCEPRQ